MKAKKQHSIPTLFLIIIICINLINVPLVRADEGTPTESPAPTQVETEPPTEPPAAATAVPGGSTPALEEAAPTPVAETVQPVSSQEPVIDVSAPAAIVFPQALANTDVVVLDEQGQPAVLGSQEAANVLVGSDPVWCPASVSIPTPGANGCSVSYASIADLLAAMQANPQSFSQNGTIFLEKTSEQGFTTPLILDDSSESLGSSFNSLNLYDLNIQGGWNPITGSTSGQTFFSGANVQVGSLANPWIGSLTINNISVLGSGMDQDAIQIFASSVVLTNVNASNSDGNGISITASEAGTVTLNNVNASNNGHTDGSEPYGSGVLINGADTFVSVLGGSFNNNARYGIEASNSTSFTIPIANVWTDQEDYSPGSVVTISGNDNNLNGNNIGFLAGETVHVYVQGPNGYTATCDAAANSYGGWSCQITLWSSHLAIGDYIYLATGLTSGVVVSGTFTDGNATIKGTVRDTNNNPISGATVSCTSGCSGSPSTTTDSAGTYTLSVSFPGSGSATVTLVASQTGYTSQQANLTVNHGQSYNQIFTLTSNTPTSTSTNTSTNTPTNTPTNTLTNTPTNTPTDTPTNTPTDTPTDSPTNTPTDTPTNTPTDTPTSTPTNTPSNTPTDTPVNTPTDTPTNTPTNTPTDTSTNTPTSTPMDTPTNTPTDTPTNTPTSTPTNTATNTPANTPTNTPIDTPTNALASTPTATQTLGGSTVGFTPSSRPRLPPTSSVFTIPLTGGELIQLDCNSVLWAFGVKLTFLNLCDQQATIHSVAIDDLPAQLPDGFTFVMGLDVDILTNGQIVEVLPDGTGIQMDFPIYDQPQDEFALLYWSDKDGDDQGEWIEVSQPLPFDEILLVINKKSGNELYQLTELFADRFYPSLTTEKTGIFILAKK